MRSPHSPAEPIRSQLCLSAEIYPSSHAALTSYAAASGSHVTPSRRFGTIYDLVERRNALITAARLRCIWTEWVVTLNCIDADNAAIWCRHDPGYIWHCTVKDVLYCLSLRPTFELIFTRDRFYIDLTRLFAETDRHRTDSTDFLAIWRFFILLNRWICLHGV